ncbi:MAG TPA: AMP-binding protein, partial [Labilithrix sp.]|nr:AMP-binding protein [Labilithrix sp.]
MTQAVPLLHDYIIDSAKRLPDKVALVAGNARLTYAEIDAQSDALARTLVSLGVERGDRVVIFADNTPETVVSFWAALKANAIVVVVNPLTKADKLAYMLNDCRAKALITDGHLTNVFAEAASRSPHLAAVVISGAIDADKVTSLPRVTPWSKALAEPGSGPPRRRSIDVDLAAIIYT